MNQHAHQPYGESQSISRLPSLTDDSEDEISDEPVDIRPGRQSARSAGKADSAAAAPARFYLFRDLETIIRASHVTDQRYAGPNTLYKNPEDGNYYLIVHRADTQTDLFNKVCNVLTEYGLQVDYMNGMDEFFTEHMNVLVRENALQTLSSL